VPDQHVLLGGWLDQYVWVNRLVRGTVVGNFWDPITSKKLRSSTTKNHAMKINSVPLLTLQNPENDPVGVDLSLVESALELGINLVRSSPSLETFSLELVGLAALLCVSTTLKEMRISLSWSCFDVKNCLCKAVRSASRPGERRGYEEKMRL
jgi:hypothetical protein